MSWAPYGRGWPGGKAKLKRFSSDAYHALGLQVIPEPMHKNRGWLSPTPTILG